MKYDIISNLKSIVKNKRRNMQYFGEIQTKYEEVFLTQSYMYFKKDEDENISAKDLKNLIKTKDDRKKYYRNCIYL